MWLGLLSGLQIVFIMLFSPYVMVHDTDKEVVVTMTPSNIVLQWSM
jgi:hypothetical protein